MLPANYNLELYRGDEYSQTFTLKQIDGENNKNPIDLSGISIKSEVRDSVDVDSAIVFVFTIARDDDKGLITISTAPQDTQGIDAGTYFYDLQVGGQTYLSGKIKVIGDITK